MSVFSSIRKASAASSEGAQGFISENSVIFNDANSAYLSRIMVAGDSTTKFGFSFRFKLGHLNTVRHLFCGAASQEIIRINADGSLEVLTHGLTKISKTTKLLRDPGAPYNVVVCIDTGQATDTDRVKIWINGNLLTEAEYTTRTLPTLSQAFSELNTASVHYIGRKHTAADYFDGVLDEIVFIDGTIEETDVGIFNENGTWLLSDPSGLTFGTNGVYLDFEIAPGTGNGAGEDVSSNGNHFTESGFSSTDQVPDTGSNDPDNGIGNFATLSPVDHYTTSPALIDGNSIATVADASVRATIGLPSSGAYYWEMYMATPSAIFLGVVKASAKLGNSANTMTGDRTFYPYVTANKYQDGSPTAYGTIPLTGETVGVLADMDAETLTFYVEGVSQGVAFSDISPGDIWVPYGGSSNNDFTLNFGQRAFLQTPPIGSLRLQTANLPSLLVADPEDGYVQAIDTEANIVATLSAAHSFANYMEVFKNRDAVENWVVRFSGDTSNQIPLNDITAKAAFPTLAGSNSWIGHAFNMSATHGMFTTTVVHTNGVDTVQAHGLGSENKMGIVRRESVGGGGWYAAHHGLTSAAYNILLNTTAAEQNTTVYAAIDDTNITVNSAAPSGTYRVIAFEEVAGFLHLPTWTGNGSADGTFINMGLSPRFLLSMETTTTHNVEVRSSIASPDNVMTTNVLNADTTAAENDVAGEVDFNCNGVKMRGTIAPNVSELYAGLCLAKEPFKTAVGR